MNISFSKAICLHVTTYENLTDRGESIVSFIKRVLNSFLPHLQNELVIELEKTNHKSQRMPYNEKNIQKIYKMFLNQEIQQLLLVDDYEWDEDPYFDENAPPTIYPPDFCLNISCNYASTYPVHFQELFIFPNEIT